MIKDTLILALLLAMGLTNTAQDSLCIDLMRPEAKVVGRYLPIKDFHLALMFECREPGRDPYTALNMLHNTMQSLHNKIITMREEGCEMIDSLINVGSLEVESQQAALYQKMSTRADSFEGHGTLYDSLCTAHDIQRVSHQEYGDSLMVRLMAWQDTLMAQGTQIARCNHELKTSGLEKRSEEYLSRYQHISEMQLIHKQFQAQLLQVENQQSRYASARQDEVFFLGPYLAERHDVKSSEGFFVHLREMQGRFRNHRSDFRIQNSK